MCHFRPLTTRPFAPSPSRKEQISCLRCIGSYPKPPGSILQVQQAWERRILPDFSLRCMVLTESSGFPFVVNKLLKASLIILTAIYCGLRATLTAQILFRRMPSVPCLFRSSHGSSLTVLLLRELLSLTSCPISSRFQGLERSWLT